MAPETEQEWTRISSFGTSDVWVQHSDGFLIIARDGGGKPDVYQMVLLDRRQVEQLAEFSRKEFA